MPVDLHTFPTRRSSDLRCWKRGAPTRCSPRPTICRPSSRSTPPAARTGCTPIPTRTTPSSCCKAARATTTRTGGTRTSAGTRRSEEHTSELQSPMYLVCPSTCTLSLHDALPISDAGKGAHQHAARQDRQYVGHPQGLRLRRRERAAHPSQRGPHLHRAARQRALLRRGRGAHGHRQARGDRKSTRLNSSHRCISYARRPAHFPYTTLFRSQMLEKGRTNTLLAKTDNMSAILKVYASGGENGLHTHPNEDHTFIVLQGSARYYDADGGHTDIGRHEEIGRAHV